MTREMLLTNEIFTNEIFTNEMIPDEELNRVNGSTCAELHELIQACDGNKPLLQVITGVGEIACSALPPGNVVMAKVMENALKDLGIKSYISVGWCGSGVRSVSNSYSKGNKEMSHAEVVDYLKKWSADTLS